MFVRQGYLIWFSVGGAVSPSDALSPSALFGAGAVPVVLAAAAAAAALDLLLSTMDYLSPKA
jgi:hypothetical protein